MAATETLSSLAMLKVNIDQGRDYLDYLRPFILQVLVDNKPDPVTDSVVCGFLRNQFGLEIPSRAVQIVLRRLSREHPIKREGGVYHITSELPDPGIAVEKGKANRHIAAVISGLLEYDNAGSKILANEDAAVNALCAFLSEFNIPYLRAYVRGTTIPGVEGKQKSHIVLISEYVLHIQSGDPERFDSFMILLQGHMLANALLCPDLQNAPKTYKGVSFFLDTPVLLQCLSLEGDAKKRAVDELIALVKRLGGVIVTFTHSRDELCRVLKGVADFIESPNGRGTIVFEARRKGVTRSDLLLLAEKVDELLSNAGIEIKTTPDYKKKYQIDEKSFEKALEDEVSYFNPRAKEDDINSVRSIYVLRADTAPSSLEKCRAVLVTSNTGFARAAYEYGKKYEESKEVSSVITDFSLANMAWLKAPIGAPSIPTTELLAYSYAALRPSQALLDKFVAETDRLQARGDISERDHQLLRSSVLVQDELMRLTLGEEAALTEETVTETLRRVTTEIKSDENEKLLAEREAHLKTADALAMQKQEAMNLQTRIYWKCNRRSGRCARFITIVVVLLLIVGLIAGLGMKGDSPYLGWAMALGSALVLIFSLANLIFGATVMGLEQRIQERCLNFLIKREAALSGLDLSNYCEGSISDTNLAAERGEG